MEPNFAGVCFHEKRDELLIRSPFVPVKKRVLFICGSINQTRQLHQVAEQIDLMDHAAQASAFDQFHSHSYRLRGQGSSVNCASRSVRDWTIGACKFAGSCREGVPGMPYFALLAA